MKLEVEIKKVEVEILSKCCIKSKCRKTKLEKVEVDMEF